MAADLVYTSMLLTLNQCSSFLSSLIRTGKIQGAFLCYPVYVDL